MDINFYTNLGLQFWSKDLWTLSSWPGSWFKTMVATRTRQKDFAITKSITKTIKHALQGDQG